MLKTSRNVFIRFVDGLVSLGLNISKIFLLLLVGILGYEVMMRYFLNKPTGYADELSGYFLAVIVMFGSAHVLKIKGHVKVEILYDRMPSKLKLAFDRFSYVLAPLSLVVLLLFTIDLIITFRASGRLSFASMLQLPMWIPICIIPIGLILFILQFIRGFLELVKEEEKSGVDYQ
jgi:TRAP-type C4-dicarboxylate transport system permease small subunit